MSTLDAVLERRLFAEEASYNKRINFCFQPDSHADFHAHPEFEEIFAKFSNDDAYRGMDISRLWCLMLNAKATLSRVPGSLAELGVYKGHSSAVLSHYASMFDRKMYLIDTFSGFSTDQLEEDLTPAKATAFRDTNIELARKTVGDYSRNIWVAGSFPECATPELSEDTFAFVSLDCDLYEPIRRGLDFFYPRLQRGGMIFVHDYSSGHWPGAARAVDEFCAASGVVVVLLADKSGTAVITKGNAR